MIKYIVDEEYVRNQAKEMAEQVKHHAFEHMKLLAEESIKMPFDERQKKQVIDIFVEEFSKRVAMSLAELQREAKKYLEARLNEKDFVLIEGLDPIG